MRRGIILKLVVACSLAVLGQPATAEAPLTYGVTINTAPLIGHAAGPFSIMFAMTDGSGVSDTNNTVAVTHLDFGGGAPSGNPFVWNGASGSLETSISLSDNAVLNILEESFVPGTTLKFSLSLTTFDDDGGVPDRLSIFIVDRFGTRIPTMAPAADYLIGLDLGSNAPPPEAFGGDPSRAPTIGSPIAIDAPSIVLTTETIPPTTVALLSPPPNAAGWSNSTVTIGLTSVDNPGGSGVGQLTYSVAGAQTISSTTVTGSVASVMINAEGVSTIAFFATDNAGNIESAKTLTVRIDKTPPTITGTRTPSPNVNGWSNTAVTVNFQCMDSLSGLAAGSPPAPTILSAEGAGQWVNGTCADLAGNAAAAIVQGINIDLTPPVLTITSNPPPNANGWNNTDVTVRFAAVDALSGVAIVSAPVTVTSEGAGQVVNGRATDLAGNLAAGSVAINLDKTPPEVFSQFDPATKDVVLFGRDSLSGVAPGPIQPVSVVSLGRQKDDDGDDMGCPDGDDVRKELRTYRILDLAGNPVTLVEKVKRRGYLLRAKFISIQYGGSAAVALPRNRESFDWDFARDGSLKELQQEFRIAPNWDGSRVEADFDARSNTTTIVKELPKPKTKIVAPGLDLLRMATAAGKLSIEF